MYIQPNTIAVLLTGVPLDETYDHTVKFASANAQRDYFLSKELMRVHPQTYQRHTENILRVEALADNLYHVNYLMFQNTSFGNKWFYAFVTKVEYVNNKTTELTYVIDVYQTWLFEMQIGQCFVEREHIVNDQIGANLVDEDLEVGDYEIFDTIDIDGFGQQHDIGSNYYIVIATTEEEIIGATGLSELEIDPSKNVISGGCYYYYTSLSNIEAVRAYILALSNRDQLDALVQIFLLPRVCVDNYVRNGSPILDTIFTVSTPESVSVGYTPKNKKLYQYPYHFLEVSDNCGETQLFKYEYFDKYKIYRDGTKVGFQFGCCFTPSSELCLIPAYYNANANADIDTIDSGFNMMMVSSSIPRIPYASDSYAIWLAQNSTWVAGHRVAGSEIFSPKKIVNAFASTVATGAALGTKLGPVAGGIGAFGAGVVSGFNAVFDNMANNEKAKMLPDKYNAGTGGVNLQYGKLGFTCYGKKIKDDMLRRIDSFFEMYGYKTNELKVPNMDSRPHWNFVKTTWANINGNIPADDIVKLKSIFNNGITFWKNPSEVGNYSLNNH